MRTPNFRRLFTTDFAEEQKELVDKLAFVLNGGIQVLYDALNKKISQTDNIDCHVTDVEVTVDVLGIPTSSTIFTLADKTRNIQGMVVQRAENLTNTSVYPSSGIFITYQQVQTGVQIQHVTGLPANNRFKLRIVAYY